MFLRLLFVLLTALNIAVGAWLLLGQPYVGIPHAADPGVRELRLLSEMPPPASSAETPSSSSIAGAGSSAVAGLPISNASSAASDTAAAAPASTGPTVDSASAPVKPTPKSLSASTARAPGAMSQTCLALGPFATPQDVRNARTALAAQIVRTRTRQDQVAQSSGWWVYLAATASHAQALELARQLSAHNIKDYFVVSSGDQPNTVSLGVFKDPANARKRRDEVAAAGFPARMSERSQAVPQYWLDLVASNTPRFDWRSHVRASGVTSRSVSCF